MLIKLGEIEYKIRFYHTIYSEQEKIEISEAFPGIPPPRGITTCILSTRGDDGRFSVEEYAGEAACNPQDQFKKSIGRKFALTRAIQDFDREERREIWEQYFSNLAAGK